MGAQSTNQHLMVFVAANGLTDGVVTVENMADGTTGFLPAGADVPLATPPTDAVYQVIHKNTAGDVYLSGKIAAGNVGKVALTSGATLPKQTLTPIVGVEGDNYVVKLNVPNYGGLLSSQDDVNFYGNYTMKAGDTATEIATALVASLQAAVDKQAVPMVAITGTDTIIATGLFQPYEQAKWSGRMPQFNLEMAQPEVSWAAAVVDEAGTPGNGFGPRVAEQEEFYAGYNTGYKNRFADWPAMTNPVLDADPEEGYDSRTIILDGAHNTGTPNVTTQRQTVIIYYP